jgi:pimeloyl-ACP methyl ester carboxylesterase
MQSVARQISGSRGVIEAYQTRRNIEGLLDELEDVITRQGHPPVTILGHSWGAWLAILFASAYPDHVRKLILVASAPLEEAYSSKIMETRMNRLDDREAVELNRLMHHINTAADSNKNHIFLQIAELIRQADAFQHDGSTYAKASFDYRIYDSIWAKAEKMRSGGALLRHASRVTCPVTAIHGDHDPHPYQGVKLPLEKTIRKFRFILMEKCGHEPWCEISAKESFYNVLEEEL